MLSPVERDHGSCIPRCFHKPSNAILCALIVITVTTVVLLRADLSDREIVAIGSSVGGVLLIAGGLYYRAYRRRKDHPIDAEISIKDASIKDASIKDASIKDAEISIEEDAEILLKKYGYDDLADDPSLPRVRGEYFIKSVKISNKYGQLILEKRRTPKGYQLSHKINVQSGIIEFLMQKKESVRLKPRPAGCRSQTRSPQFLQGTSLRFSAPN